MLSKKSKSLLKIIDEYVSDRELRKMMKWRKENERFYAEQPDITFPSFKRGFQEHYIKQRRILFWVINHNGTKMGHMGLYQIVGDSCEIDNVVRGNEGDRGIMSQAVQELLAIARRLFKNINLKVLSSNRHAIKFYKDNGFI